MSRRELAVERIVFGCSGASGALVAVGEWRPAVLMFVLAISIGVGAAFAGRGTA